MGGGNSVNEGFFSKRAVCRGRFGELRLPVNVKACGQTAKKGKSLYLEANRSHIFLWLDNAFLFVLEPFWCYCSSHSRAESISLQIMSQFHCLSRSLAKAYIRKLTQGLNLNVLYMRNVFFPGFGIVFGYNFGQNSKCKPNMTLCAWPQFLFCQLTIERKGFSSTVNTNNFLQTALGLGDLHGSFPRKEMSPLPIYVYFALFPSGMNHDQGRALHYDQPKQASPFFFLLSTYSFALCFAPWWNPLSGPKTI